jgi:predicted phage terminase large subunit-like protein
MPPRSPLFSVPEPDVDPILQEVLIRAEAKERAIPKTFDPGLGKSYKEAEASLEHIRGDIGKYGEYVFGLAPARVHQLWNRVADDVINHRVPQNKVLFLAPPNTAKSTWNSLIRPTHYLGNHPDHNLLFFTSSDPMSNTFHRAIEAVFRDNEKYQKVFPDEKVRPDRKRGWSSDGLYLMGTPAISKDGAYRSVGFGASVMGARAHGIIIDDPLNQEQAKSEAEQRRAKEYSSQTVMRRLQPAEGWVIAVMTRFHENDLASHYIKLAEEDAGWIVIRTPLIATNDPEPDPLGRATGELLWPEFLTERFTRNVQREMSIAEFNLIYQVDPTGMGGDIFESEAWFQGLPLDFWSTIMPRCQILQFWDMAFSEKKQTCFSVGITVAVDPELNMYILHLIRKRLNTGDAEDEMVRIIRITKPLIVGIETDKFHQRVIYTLARNILDQVMCNIQLIRPEDDKIARARLPAGRAQAGKVFIDKQAPWYRTFVSECLGFPNTKYKDQVDALSGVTALVQKVDQVIRTKQRSQVEHVMSA